MNNYKLNRYDIRSLKHFKGYGSLSAHIWFLGFEESLGKRKDNTYWSPGWELNIRASWTPVIDLKTAHRQLKDYYWNRKNYSQVWKVMAKLTRGIIHKNENWNDSDLAHEYVVSKLGRFCRDTFLGEIMPLPSPTLSDWPYKELFPNRDIYDETVWPDRKVMWSELVGKHKPKIIICYGKGSEEKHWDKCKEIFQKASWEEDVIKDRILTASIQDKTRLYLTPFFGQGQYRISDLEELILHANRF